MLWKSQKSDVHIWQYDEAGRVWTGSKIDKFVKSSEIVNISRLSVDILQNFWYCDGVRKVVPIFGKAGDTRWADVQRHVNNFLSMALIVSECPFS